MKLFALALVCGCFVAALAEKARFDNYRVYSVNVENDIQLKVLRALEEYPDGITFLDSPHFKKSVDIIVPPHKFADVSEFFNTYELKHRIKTNNLQKLVDDEQPKFSVHSGLGWQKYYDLNEIYDYLDEQLERYPDILTSYNYGKSYENRTLRAVKVSFKAGNPTIFIESTIHAREWITAATATYLLNELITSDDAEIRALAESYDWVIIPVVNVDGYQYTHTTNRFWRKTRKPYAGTDKICTGADPNRNFDVHHAESGSSTHPCTDIYAGPYPYSEPETLALSEFIKSFDNIKLYITFHSYSQLLLFPYGYTKEKSRHHADLLQIGEATIKAIAQRYGTEYVVGSIAETIYQVSGSSIDWVYDKLNIPLTYSFEFRDRGEHGFTLPANQIIPNSLEIIDGLKALVKEAESINYL